MFMDTNNDPMSMEWRDIHFKIGDNEILRGTSGCIKPGRLAAVMGASGSGKTTLLNVLSGRQRTKGRERTSGNKLQLSMTGDICINGRKVKRRYVRDNVAYVFQDVALLETETPRECLNFSALLRLPRSVSREERERYVDRMLSCFALKGCSGTPIGSALRKGLSGGEQKRVSIGVELISNPKMLFLDEPLSGLDAYNAFTCTRSLKMLAGSSVPVMMTLHQPSSEIFAEIDDLFIIDGGQVCYHGPAEGLVDHFNSLGFTCPVNFNPSDFVMFTIARSSPEVVTGMKEGWLESDLHKNLVSNTTNNSESSNESDAESDESFDIEQQGPCRAQGPDSAKESDRNLCEVLRALVARDFRMLRRQLDMHVTAHVQMLIVALAYGWFFFRNGARDSSPDYGPSCAPEDFQFAACTAKFGAHFAVTSLISMNMMIVSLGMAVDILHRDRPVLLREVGGGYYGVVPYFISKTIFEVFMSSIGCLVTLAGTFWLVGFRGNFFVLFCEILLMATSTASLMYSLSAGASSREAAAAMTLLPQVLQFAFSGILMPIELIPASLRWLKYFCPLYYGLGLVCATEFSYVYDTADQCKDKFGANWTEACPGTNIELEALSLHDVHRGQAENHVIALFVSIFVLRGIAIMNLYRKTKYAV